MTTQKTVNSKMVWVERKWSGRVWKYRATHEAQLACGHTVLWDTSAGSFWIGPSRAKCEVCG
jgi:hypothetical protein